jgi:acetyl/propionyl-CoA carboxylase alpha subunit
MWLFSLAACLQTELKQEVQMAKAEAMSAFGNDTLLIEKYVEQARHIEFQVVGDHFGHMVYLPERDCSVQRRNQKVHEGATAAATA